MNEFDTSKILAELNNVKGISGEIWESITGWISGVIFGRGYFWNPEKFVYERLEGITMRMVKKDSYYGLPYEFAVGIFGRTCTDFF